MRTWLLGDVDGGRQTTRQHVRIVTVGAGYRLDTVERHVSGRKRDVPDSQSIVGHDSAKDCVVVGPRRVEQTVERGHDGKSLALLGTIDDDGSATVWPGDVATGLRTEPTIEVDDLAWADISPSGHRILLGSADGVTIFDGSSGEALGTVSSSSQRGGFITVADQLFLVSTGGELTHYDLDSLEPIRTFDGSLGFIQTIHGTADGSLILTRGGEGWANLYDVASGIRLGAPIPIPVEDELQTASIALDGSRLAIGGGIENGYQIWDLDPDHWVEAACRLAGRNLTRQEWATNIGPLPEYRPTCPQFPLQG